MRAYFEKQSVINAVRWNGDNFEEISNFCDRVEEVEGSDSIAVIRNTPHCDFMQIGQFLVEIITETGGVRYVIFTENEFNDRFQEVCESRN